MDGGSQGAASAFWATASQGEVVTFFRHLGEDVSMLGNADLQVAARLARERLPRLSDRAVVVMITDHCHRQERFIIRPPY